MKSSIAHIVTMNLRSYVPCVAQSKMFNRCALTVVFAWVDTFAPNASFSTTMVQTQSFFNMQNSEDMMISSCPRMLFWILCNDCVETSEVSFHSMALKCPKCKSYYTRRTQAVPSAASSSSSRIE
ncbi:hypothetical protein JHK82_054026 [Glycine max]|nr:hypothetical protein JHK85_054827 [Glycine max]KAG5086629.1 hypothetical protein JHK82_054026 [Glycine max]